MRGHSIFFTEFIIALAIVTGDEVIKNGRVPLPSRYVWLGVGFGLLSFIAPFTDEKLAAVLGGGIVLALLYQLLPSSDNPPGTTPTPSGGGGPSARVE